MNQYLLIEPHFLPSIQYVALLTYYKKVIFDDIVRFRKQSYLTRSYIRTPQGPQSLIVPVQKGKTKLSVGKVRIDNHHEWIAPMVRTLRFNYSHSPFFMFFFDMIVRPIQSRFEYLAELNVALIQAILRALQVEWKWSWRSKWQQLPLVDDYCYHIHPKTRYHVPDPAFTAPRYYQLYAESDGTFYANLSIVDLLFNEGLDSVAYLIEAYANKNRHLN